MNSVLNLGQKMFSKPFPVILSIKNLLFWRSDFQSKIGQFGPIQAGHPELKNGVSHSTGIVEQNQNKIYFVNGRPIGISGEKQGQI